MNARTLLKTLSGAAAATFLIAAIRVSDEDIFEHRKTQRRRYYDKHPRWTDKNRWK